MLLNDNVYCSAQEIILFYFMWHILIQQHGFIEREIKLYLDIKLLRNKSKVFSDFNSLPMNFTIFNFHN